MKRFMHLVWFVGLICCTRGCRADLVIISLPSTISFLVTDVTQATTGSPNPFIISFAGLAIPGVDKLYISVRANASTFTPPSGTAIPASNVSWTTSGAVGGAGFAGTLSSAAYTSIYQSNLLVVLGQINVTWSLSAPGAGIRAGIHTLTITYKLADF